MHPTQWTPQDVKDIIGLLGGIIGGLVTIIKLLRNNHSLAISAQAAPTTVINNP